MKGFVNKLYDIDSIEIPAEMLNVCVDEQRIEEEIRTLSLRFAKETTADCVEKGDLVYCQADENSYPDGRTILIYTGMNLPGAEAAAAALADKKVGDTVATTLAEKSVTLIVTKVLRRTPVEVNDALIAGMNIDGVHTVEDYKAYVRARITADLQMENSKMITKYFIDQMTENSTYTYDEAEMEAYAAPLFIQYKQEIEEMGETMSDEEIKASILAQCKQEWMTKAFCESKNIEIDEASVEEEMDRTIEMMELTGEPIPERGELKEMMLQNEYFMGLMNYINQIVEQKVGGTHGNS